MNGDTVNSFSTFGLAFGGTCRETSERLVSESRMLKGGTFDSSLKLSWRSKSESDAFSPRSAVPGKKAFVVLGRSACGARGRRHERLAGTPQRCARRLASPLLSTAKCCRPAASTCPAGPHHGCLLRLRRRRGSVIGLRSPFSWSAGSRGRPSQTANRRDRSPARALLSA